MGARSLREGCGLLQCKLDRFKRFSAAAGVRMAENGEKQCKTVSLAPKRPLQLSKFKFLNSKFEFQASSCIKNLKYHIYEHLRSMGAREASTDQKTSKNSENSDFGAKTTVTALKIQIFEFKFRISSLSLHYKPQISHT